MGSFSIWHWLIVLAVVILVFGTKKLSSLGTDVGSAIRNFKKSMNDGEAQENTKQLNHMDEDADFDRAGKSAKDAKADSNSNRS